MSDGLKTGDVVQIGPDAKVNDALRGQLAFVTEVKSWGCTAGIPDFGSTAVAYVRLAQGDYDLVGAAPWVPGWVVE